MVLGLISPSCLLSWDWVGTLLLVGLALGQIGFWNLLLVSISLSLWWFCLWIRWTLGAAGALCGLGGVVVMLTRMLVMCLVDGLVNFLLYPMLAMRQGFSLAFDRLF